MDGLTVSVVIPAYNESGRIGAAVRAAWALPGAHEVLVIDDGSVDSTAEEAQSAGATRVIRHGTNRGKGAALTTGCRAASGDVILLLDADLGETVAEAVKLLDPILRDEADVVVAGFPASRQRGGFGVAMRLACWGVKALTGQTVEFPLSGQRAMQREVVQAIGSFAGGYGVETAMTVDVLCRGYRLIEVPTQMRHRVTGRDWAGFVHRGRQLRDIARVLLVRALIPRPASAKSAARDH